MSLKAVNWQTKRWLKFCERLNSKTHLLSVLLMFNHCPIERFIDFLCCGCKLLKICLVGFGRTSEIPVQVGLHFTRSFELFGPMNCLNTLKPVSI